MKVYQIGKEEKEVLKLEFLNQCKDIRFECVDVLTDSNNYSPIFSGQIKIKNKNEIESQIRYIKDQLKYIEYSDIHLDFIDEHFGLIALYMYDDLEFINK